MDGQSMGGHLRKRDGIRASWTWQTKGIQSMKAKCGLSASCFLHGHYGQPINSKGWTLSTYGQKQYHELLSVHFHFEMLLRKTAVFIDSCICLLCSEPTLPPLAASLLLPPLLLLFLLQQLAVTPNVITTVGPMRSANMWRAESISPWCVLQIIQRSFALLGVWSCIKYTKA